MNKRYIVGTYNTTDSSWIVGINNGVQIHDRFTKFTVSCHATINQHKNKAICMAYLRAIETDNE